MKCKKHPKYKGIYPPRVKCDECWRVYYEVRKCLVYLQKLNIAK